MDFFDVKMEITPLFEEPFIVTEDDADAAEMWLETRVTDGRFTECKPYPQTGGFVRLRVEAPGECEAKTIARDMFDDYPLLSTIDFKIDIVLPTLKDGFDVLRAAIRDKRHIDQ